MNEAASTDTIAGTGQTHHRSAFGRAALLASLALLVAPSAASASGLRQFVVGPVPVGHGYSVLAFQDGCGSVVPNLFNPPPADFGDYGIEFIKSVPGGTEVHTYTGATAARCDFSTGQFKLHVGRLATIDVTLHPHTLSMTGTFKVDIDPSYFGRVNRQRIRGSIRTEASRRCGHYTGMTAYFGSWRRVLSRVSAAFLPHGHSSVAIETGRTVARTIAGVRGVRAVDGIYLTGGPSLFDPAPDLESATINGPGGPVTGQLSFAMSQGSYSGSLSGSLRVAFDVGGTRTLKGSAAVAIQPPVEEFPCG